MFEMLQFWSNVYTEEGKEEPRCWGGERLWFSVGLGLDLSHCRAPFRDGSLLKLTLDPKGRKLWVALAGTCDVCVHFHLRL